MMLKVLPEIPCHNNSIVIIILHINVIYINIHNIFLYCTFKGSFSMHFIYENKMTKTRYEIKNYKAYLKIRIMKTII